MSALTIGVAALAAFAAGPAMAKTKSSPRKFVYAQTNEPAANHVLVFKRNTASGKIRRVQTVATGGRGTTHQQPFGLPVVDTANSVVLTPAGRLLFAVNSGDNSVSSFRVTSAGLRLADRASSGGIMPVSLALRGRVLYVLNGLSGSILGYHFNSSGKLRTITDSAQALSVVGPNGIAAGLGFTPDGRWLIASLRYLPLQEGTNGQNGIIDRFRIAANGAASPVVGTEAATPTPFGFDFTSKGLLVTSAVGVVNTTNNQRPPLEDGKQMNGSAQSYSISSTGALTPISNAAANGRATCWLVITDDDKFAFATNTLSAASDSPVRGNPIGTGKNALSRFSIGADGTLTLLGNTDAGPGFGGDVALSKDDKYLYEVQSSLGVLGDAVSYVGVYSVGSDGSLTLVQMTPMKLPAGLSGMAAY